MVRFTKYRGYSAISSESRSYPVWDGRLWSVHRDGEPEDVGQAVGQARDPEEAQELIERLSLAEGVLGS